LENTASEKESEEEGTQDSSNDHNIGCFLHMDSLSMHPTATIVGHLSKYLINEKEAKDAAKVKTESSTTTNSSSSNVNNNNNEPTSGNETKEEAVVEEKTETMEKESSETYQPKITTADDLASSNNDAATEENVEAEEDDDEDSIVIVGDESATKKKKTFGKASPSKRTPVTSKVYGTASQKETEFVKCAVSFVIS
jgi:hypothetical protein